MVENMVRGKIGSYFEMARNEFDQNGSEVNRHRSSKGFESKK